MANIWQLSCVFASIVYIRAADIPALPIARTSMPDISNAHEEKPAADATARQYDSTLARNKMMPLAAAAYTNSGNITRCLDNTIGGGARIQRQLHAPLPGQYGLFNTNVSGYTAVSPADRAIIIVFRGTDGGIIQLLEEANQVTNWFNFYNVGYVHRYFNDAFAFLWNLGMSNDFNTLKNANPGYDLWITGHSLGGSVASIAAAFIVLTDLYPGNKIKLVTFGQPRSGDKEFANYLDSKISYIYRIVHAYDLVPHVPPPLIGYHHHSTEIWYNNTMTAPPLAYRICAGDLPECSNSIPTLQLKPTDHHVYFAHCIDSKGYGDAGCNGSYVLSGTECGK